MSFEVSGEYRLLLSNYGREKRAPGGRYLPYEQEVFQRKDKVH